MTPDLAALPPGVTVHVLPAGDDAPPGAANLRYRDFSAVPDRIERARAAAAGIAQAQLVEYDGAPHGLNVTHADRLSKDLITFLGG